MSEAVFSEAHPHYTPAWLSKRACEILPPTFAGSVVDPACGAGNLLLAAALRLSLSQAAPQLPQFVGYDSSRRAIRRCTEALARVIPSSQLRLEHGDFLRLSPRGLPRPVAVIMNPPFRGYGQMPNRLRRGLQSRFALPGRFNLAHAFVLHAINALQPDLLTAILPSTWAHSRSSAFRDWLSGTPGEWTWLDIDGDAFPGLAVHVGILSWRRRDRALKPPLPQSLPQPRKFTGFDVRQGVATGRDGVFEAIAQSPPPCGSVVPAVRGKDVGRGTGSLIWVPPSPSSRNAAICRRSVSRSSWKALRDRSCVRAGLRSTWEFHESAPSWFLGEPKLLLPEVVCGPLRMELDSAGEKLPLHSVVAVRLPSVRDGELLLRHLSNGAEYERLIASSPHLSGGARRLLVGSVRESIARWLTGPDRAAAD